MELKRSLFIDSLYIFFFFEREIKNEISKGNFLNYLFMSLVLKRRGCE